MNEIIENKKKQYLMEGIINEIIIESNEKERHTFLGSTDRKGYTIKTVAMWLDEKSESYTNIEPYYESERVYAILKRIESESKHRMSELVYKKYFI